MARIRTVKPELFRHEELFELERETGLPIRLAWVGLFTVADKEGRFEWKPSVLKLDILPFDEIDFSRVLHALATRGLIVRYACPTRGGRKEYGAIPTWLSHQVVNHREKPSAIPSPSDENSEIINDYSEKPTREARVGHALTTRHGHTQGEGEGKGKGKGKGNKDFPAPLVADADGEKGLRDSVWSSYAEAYRERYGVDPLRNATVNSQVKALAQRLGKDAPEVVRFYVKHPDSFFAKNTHSIGLCLSRAESLHTQWAKGQAITQTDIRRYEHNADLTALLETMKRDGV